MKHLNKKLKIVTTFIKKNKVSLSVILLLLIAAFSFQYFNKTSYALSEPVTGTSGTCQWTIDTAGKMTIEPQSGQESCTLSSVVVENIDGTDRSIMPWYPNKDNIIDVEVKNGVIANNNSYALFAYLPNVVKIDLNNLDTKNVTSMSYFFSGDTSLIDLDLSDFVTSKATSFSGMFSGCNSLENLSLSSFETDKVTTMYGMFQNCKSLKSLDLSNIDTSNVVNLSQVFYGCNALISVDLSNIDTSNATNLGSMFAGCSSLKQLDLSNFNTDKVTYMAGMFNSCTSLSSLDLSDFNTSKVTDFGSMFNWCSKLTELNLSNFDIGKASSISSMFANCRRLELLNLSSFEINSDVNINSLFINIGMINDIGTRLILNDSFDNATYATNSGYYFPYAYYVKETNGVLSSKLYTLSEMQTDVTGSNTPTTWVPAYSVTYNGNTGTISGNNTLVKTYRIGSKINTKGVTPVKNNYEFANWKDTQNGNNPTITINKNGSSTNTYGSKYAAVGTNGNITLYAQYNLPVSDVEFYKKDDITGDPVSGAAFSLTGTSDAGTTINKTATSGNDGKVTFTDVPFGTYKVHETTVPTGYNSNNLRDFNVTVSE